MPINTNVKTRWEEQALAVWILDPETGEPTGYGSSPLYTKLPAWYYIGGQTVTLAASVSALVPNIPGDATIFEIRARGGEVYYNLNGATASVLSPAYIPEDQAEIVGPLDNLVSLAVFSTTAATVVHIMWFREA